MILEDIVNNFKKSIVSKVGTVLIGAGLAASLYMFGCGKQSDIDVYTQSPQQYTNIACSDGIDNDGDTLIDNFDPGCYSNGIYFPTDTNEVDEVPTPENQAPVLVDLIASPDVTSIGKKSEIHCVAYDADDDALTYDWNITEPTIPMTGHGGGSADGNWREWGSENYDASCYGDCSMIEFIPYNIGIFNVECTASDGELSDSSNIDLNVSTQCSDETDNDGDTLIDYNDLGCYTNNLYDPLDDNEGDEPVFECSDGIDNDTDSLIDEAEPGCYRNGTYDPHEDERLDFIVNSEVTNPIGMTFDGTYFWIADEVDKKVHKLDNNGVLLGSFSGPFGQKIDGVAYDFNSGNLWILRYPSGDLYKIDKERAIADGNTNSAIISSIGSKGTYTESLAFDGTNLWISRSDRIKKVDSITGNVTGEFVDTSPIGGRPYDCTWKDNLVCAYGGTGAPIYEIDTTKALAEGNINNSILTTYTPIAQSAGVAFDESTLCYILSSNGMIYFIETE